MSTDITHQRRQDFLPFLIHWLTREQSAHFIYWDTFIYSCNTFYICFYMYISNALYLYMIGLLCFALILWYINHCWLFKVKSCFYIYIKYIICRYAQLNEPTVLILTIQFSKSQQTSMVPSIATDHWLFNLTSVICLHTVKWSNSSISNNSIEHKSFVCTQVKCQTVLFDW